MTCLVAAAVLALFAAQSAAPSPAEPTPNAWIDVRLGDAAAVVQQRLGDPLRVTQESAGVTALRYLVNGMNDFALIFERANRVIAIRLRHTESSKVSPVVVTDAAGVSLGDSLELLQRKRGTPSKTNTVDGNEVAIYHSVEGVETDYELHDGVVSSIAAVASPGDIGRFTKEPGAAVIDHDGTSQDHAIVDRQPSERTGVDWEYVYVAYHPCDGSTRWKSAGRASSGGRSSTISSTSCVPPRARRARSSSTSRPTSASLDARYRLPPRGRNDQR